MNHPSLRVLPSLASGAVWFVAAFAEGSGNRGNSERNANPAVAEVPTTYYDEYDRQILFP